jgi:hypothetical protein
VKALCLFAAVTLTVGLVGKELIDILNRIDSVFGFGNFGKVEVIKLAALQCPMQRPFRQRNLEQRLVRRGPPLHVFPRAGLGNSLGRDPNTGRSYWTNMP